MAGIDRPQLVLRLGIVGKIRLGEKQEQCLESTGGTLLGMIADSLVEEGGKSVTGQFFDDGSKGVIRMISNLAAGSDQVLVGAGFDQESSSSASFDLQCLLPFDQECYREKSVRGSLEGEAGDRAARRLDHQVGQASQVVELDGKFVAGEAGMSARHRAYRSAAWFLLQQTDLLVAAFEGCGTEGAGGTLETVRKALEAGIPVLSIDLAGTCGEDGMLPVRLLTRPRELDRPPGDFDLESGVARLVRRLVAFPGDGQGGDERDDLAERSIREFHSGTVPRKSYRVDVWRYFMKLFAGGGSPPSNEITIDPFESHRKRASMLSRHYSNRYRGAFLINFLLLSLVVVIVAGFELAFADGRVPIWLALVKIAIIGYIYWNAHLANTRDWHRRGIDFRMLSELLRSSNYLAPLAVASPSARLPVQYSLNSLSNSWSIWLFRSIVRAEPIAVLPDDRHPQRVQLAGGELELARERLTKNWLSGQIGHHENNARGMGQVFERLEWLSRWLIRLLLIAVVTQAGLEIIRAVSNSPQGGGGDEALWGWLIFIGAVAPAVVATCAGVVYQSECRRLSDRSMAMSKSLGRRLDDLRDDTPHPDGCQAWTLASDALFAAQEIADEVADWHMLNQPHEVSAV